MTRLHSARLPSLRKPSALTPGMRLGVVAPGAGSLDKASISLGVRALQKLGFDVELGAHALDLYGHLAGTDQARADDLLTMLERPDIDGVICLRGGGGSMRTARAVDVARLAALAAGPPKVFVGYSDITVIHYLIQAALGWVTFYGPMVVSFADASEYVVEGFRGAVTTCRSLLVGPSPRSRYVETIVPGAAEGPLVGGCLTLLAQLVGTPWQPSTDGAIVFFEDVNEEPYAIERYLSQLLAAGWFERCAGVVVGEHANCKVRRPGPSPALEDVFAELLTPLQVPILYNLPLGHGGDIATLPLGVPVRLDADAGVLHTLESGVDQA